MSSQWPVGQLIDSPRHEDLTLRDPRAHFSLPLHPQKTEVPPCRSCTHTHAIIAYTHHSEPNGIFIMDQVNPRVTKTPPPLPSAPLTLLRYLPSPDLPHHPLRICIPMHTDSVTMTIEGEAIRRRHRCRTFALVVFMFFEACHNAETLLCAASMASSGPTLGHRRDRKVSPAHQPCPWPRTRDATDQGPNARKRESDAQNDPKISRAVAAC